METKCILVNYYCKLQYLSDVQPIKTRRLVHFIMTSWNDCSKKRSECTKAWWRHDITMKNTKLFKIPVWIYPRRMMVINVIQPWWKVFVNLLRAAASLTTVWTGKYCSVGSIFTERKTSTSKLKLHLTVSIRLLAWQKIPYMFLRLI